MNGDRMKCMDDEERREKMNVVEAMNIIFPYFEKHRTRIVNVEAISLEYGIDPEKVQAACELLQTVGILSSDPFKRGG